MKKLMFLAVAVMSGFIASATTVKWSVIADTCVATAGSEAGEYDGYLVYIINDHTTAASGIGALLKANAEDLGTYLDDIKLGSGAVDYDYFDLNGTGLDSYMKTVDDKEVNTATVYALILNSDDASKADKYYVSGPHDIEVTSAVEKGVAGFGIGDVVIGSGDWVDVAPEPTSGLLLLIGVAGLALRRRRA